MQPHDDIRLRHMLDSAEEAVGFAVGKSRNDLDDDRKLRSLCIRNESESYFIIIIIAFPTGWIRVRL
jgi:hypothetical protein